MPDLRALSKKPVTAILGAALVLTIGVRDAGARSAWEYDLETVISMFVPIYLESVVAYPRGGDDECCSDPGKIAECWEKDAEDDGVTCSSGGDCPSGSCADNGLCSCSKQEHCNDGDKMNGVCNKEEGYCGPSFCNGVIKCSCFGGCAPEDLGPYANPREKCEDTAHGYPGFCCEGNYPKTPDGTVEGFCAPSNNCQGCTDDADCDDGNPCTADQCIDSDCINADLPNGSVCASGEPLPADLSSDCAAFQCNDGTCEVSNLSDGTECTDNVKPPAAPAAWDDDCWYNSCQAGVCKVEQRAEEYPCDDENDCSSASECTAGGACVATSPVSPPTGECCDDTIADSFDDGNSCTSDWCDAEYRDQHLDKPENATCDPPLDDNDTCGQWLCDDTATCVETTAPYVGLDCHSAATGGPGPGGDASACMAWRCSDAAGEEGDCISIVRNDGVACGWENPPDSCGAKTCQSGSCEFAVATGTTPCTPATGPVDPCCDYECDVDHTCVEGTCAVPVAAYEECNGGWIGTLAATIGSTLDKSDNNKCTANDHSPDVTGIFATCGLVDDGESVFNYNEVTHPTEFRLRHTLVEVEDDGSWDPILYTATSCEETGAGPDTQPDQYTCGIAGTVTTGPWPLRDLPTSASAVGYTTEDTYTSYVFVDARNSTSPSGGPYDLTATVEEHVNNGCVNAADLVAAPRFEGGPEWKTRYRGTLSGYENFFAASGVDLNTIGYCADAPLLDGGVPDDTDPKTAFFRVDLPDGDETLSTGTTAWPHTYKVYSDHMGMIQDATALSWWGNNAPDGSCLGSLTSMMGCQAPPKNGPPEFVVREGDLLRSGWVAVTNASAGTGGGYEVNVLRVPRAFLGMHQFFVGSGLGLGCAGTETSFGLAGYRLDFIPINDDVGGYAVRKSYYGDKWLVSGGAPEWDCDGKDCTTPGDTTPMDIGFQFPFAGDLWPYLCIDAAGRILLAKDMSGCENKWDINPDTLKFHETEAPAIAPLWGTIMPCRKIDYPSCGTFGWNGDGDVECLDGSCSGGVGSCNVWKWAETSCNQNGRGRSQFVEFEGTAARVVTWDGFDGYFNPVTGGNVKGLEFQVILRVDGRITFFYKIPKAGAVVWDEIMANNAWMIGMSGGRAAPCSNDGQCDTAFGASGLYCDTGPPTTVNGQPVWTPRDRCMNPVDLQQAGSVQVGGAWQGE
jgi:hypothetical protein